MSTASDGVPHEGASPAPVRPDRSRRLLIRLVVAAVAALAVVGGVSVALADHGGGRPTAVPSAPAYSPRPNVVLVLTDDLSTDLVQYMPHVVALMRSGMTFTNYSVTDTLCCPSRASLFTGEYPHDTGVYTNTVPDGGQPAFLRGGGPAASYGPALQRAGYRTAMMGKYLNGYMVGRPQYGGLPANYVPQGWDDWVVGSGAYKNFDYSLNVDGEIRSYGSRPQDYLTRVITKYGQDFIANSVQRRKPFALELATYTPHAPYTPDPRDEHSFPALKAPRDPSYDRTPTGAPRWLNGIKPITPHWQQRIDLAYRKRVQGVQSVDRAIGDLQSTLRATGQLANTVFVFTSDNGYHMGQYRLLPGKRTAFDTDVHVPLVVSGPGIAQGSTSDAVVQNIDLTPTFEDLAGERVPPTVDGRSIVPLLHGTATAWRTLGLVEHHGPDIARNDPDYQVPGSGNPASYVALRGNGWTYVRYRDTEREYYDRRTDPYMLHNLAASLSPARRAELDRWAATLSSCHGGSQCWAAGRPERLT